MNAFSFSDCLSQQHSGHTRKRQKKKDIHTSESEAYESNSQTDLENRVKQWKRIILLITAVTIHNIPGKQLIKMSSMRSHKYFHRGTCCWS